MFVLCLLYKNNSRNISDVKKEGFKGTKWIKGTKRKRKNKKIPRGRGFLSLESVVCCEVEVSASG
jgi:hypothetical protein